MTDKMKIKSVEDYISVLKKIQNRLKNHNLVCEIWFRGEDKVDILTPLIPKAYRIYNDPDIDDAYLAAKAIEGNFKAQFRRQAQPYLSSKGIIQNDWNEYFLMQHYGLKTRLLDWTGSALIALYFAIENLSENDSRVWILNPHTLNKFTTSIIHPENKGFSGLTCPAESQKTDLFDENNRWNVNVLNRKYLEMEFDSDKNLSYYPLAIMPSFLDERMSMQNSCFTIFGNVVNGLLGIDKYSGFL